MFRRAIYLDENYAAPYAFGALWHSIRIGLGLVVRSCRRYGDMRGARFGRPTPRSQ
jgi:hypothetical protein